MNNKDARFGLTTLTCIVIASMIGSGVFTTSGYSLLSLVSPGRVLLAWCVGGLIALCGAIAYGELARRLPISGGEYLYLSRKLHPFAGFLAGWVSLTAGFSGAIAMAAITFEAYAVPDSIRPTWLPPNAAAITAIVLFGTGHAFLVRLFAAIQNGVVAVKLLALSAFLAVAAMKISSHEWNWAPLDQPVPPLLSMNGLMAMAGSIMWISLSYAGFNAAVYIASEVKDAERNVPRSLWLGTLLVTGLYVLLNAVFVSAAPVSEIAGQKEIAAISAKAIGGSSLELLIRAAIGLGTLSSVASMIMTGPRVFSRMADDGLFPAVFRSGPHSISRTVLFQTAIAALLVFVSDLRQLLGYLSTTLAISSAVTVMTVLIPQRTTRTGDAATPPSLWIKLCAAFYVCSTFVIAGLMAKNNPRDLIATGATFLLGGLLWLVTQRTFGRSSSL
jgi:APA family basic amino acid/polyamine antiporter